MPGTNFLDVPSQLVEEMQDLVDMYSTFAPLPSVSETNPVACSGHVIFLSGTTGSLGSYLLQLLLLDESVAKIYAFNRRGPNSVTMMERHVQIFSEKGLDPSVLQTHRRKYELLEGDLAQECFGLTERQFLEMASSVNIIVHNAWPVNLNMALKSFTPVIKGMSNLLAFAIASPQKPAFLFSSTFTTLQKGPASGIPHKEAPIPPQWSTSTGYMRSKWVVEQLMAQATKSSGLRTLSVRVGQLCGGDNGSWRAEEWFPSMILSGASLGMIPTNDSVVNWMVLPTAAKAYLDFIKASGSITGHQVVHLVHPRPVPLQDIAQAIAQELDLPVVPFPEWFKVLHTLINESGKDLKTLAKTFPLIRTIPLIEPLMMRATHAAPLVDATAVPMLDMSNALRMSPTLRDPAIPRLNRKVVRNWLRHLGLLPTARLGIEGQHLARL
ncbi:male sterility protein-domain-containing protein [Coprinopsis sp. MPI-PUGE-AT-0042]|nr:male sterility protein-domain-containing protein [Coprinopsis sp. MPI-PUGE-AT-0042]